VKGNPLQTIEQVLVAFLDVGQIVSSSRRGTVFYPWCRWRVPVTLETVLSCHSHRGLLLTLGWQANATDQVLETGVPVEGVKIRQYLN